MTRKIQDVELTVGDDDGWYTICRVEPVGVAGMRSVEPGVFCFYDPTRISDADVEGTEDEMLDIARAIRARGRFTARRCAVYVDAAAGAATFWSPRNTIDHDAGCVPLSRADDLAGKIEAMFADRIDAGGES